MKTEKILTVRDIPQKEACLNCNICIRLRLMEMGVIPGQKLRIKQHQKNLWTITIMEDELPISTFGLRQDEIERILFEDECFVTLE